MAALWALNSLFTAFLCISGICVLFSSRVQLNCVSTTLLCRTAWLGCRTGPGLSLPLEHPEPSDQHCLAIAVQGAQVTATQTCWITLPP